MAGMAGVKSPLACVLDGRRNMACSACSSSRGCSSSIWSGNGDVLFPRAVRMDCPNHVRLAPAFERDAATLPLNICEVLLSGFCSGGRAAPLCPGSTSLSDAGEDVEVASRRRAIACSDAAAAAVMKPVLLSSASSPASNPLPALAAVLEMRSMALRLPAATFSAARARANSKASPTLNSSCTSYTSCDSSNARFACSHSSSRSVEGASQTETDTVPLVGNTRRTCRSLGRAFRFTKSASTTMARGTVAVTACTV
mmetsp:Transcript_10350/g.17985  ORF Transcript_10350/g.17985 Transcript_10350/m.17985 type:complete len:255 (+) Transcript_10350:460-1224(+)